MLQQIYSSFFVITVKEIIMQHYSNSRNNTGILSIYIFQQNCGNLLPELLSLKNSSAITEVAQNS